MLSSIVAFILSEQVVTAMLWISFVALIFTVVFVFVMTRKKRREAGKDGKS